jgi:hypothetical protein
MREYHESEEENELEIIHSRKNVLKQQIQLIEENDIESANIENPQSYF